jgi:hypothetical protein
MTGQSTSDAGRADVGSGSLASDLTCQRHVRLDRDLGHSGGTGEEFRAGIQRSVDKGLAGAPRIGNLREVHPGRR